MTQQEIVNYFEGNGGLLCGSWTIDEIYHYLKSCFGASQRVYKSTCRQLKAIGTYYQR